MLSPRSQSNIAMGVAFRKGIIVYSDETLAELEKKIYLPKFDKYVPLSRRLMFYHRFAFTAFPINITTHIEACRDPKDDMFLELAKSADADCIVNKNRLAHDSANISSIIASVNPFASASLPISCVN